MDKQLRDKQKRISSELQLMTGWWGIPGGPESASTKTHITKFGFNSRNAGRVPVCGAYIGPHQEFQWCSYGVRLEYIECERCKRSPEYKQAVQQAEETYKKWRNEMQQRLRASRQPQQRARQRLSKSSRAVRELPST